MTSVPVKLPHLLPPADWELEWQHWYRRYLQGPMWAMKRALCILMASGVCQMHGCTRTAVQVHHKSYKRLGDEPLGDLMALCQQCHAREHGKPPMKKD